jgi:hypothetical protein
MEKIPLFDKTEKILIGLYLVALTGLIFFGIANADWLLVVAVLLL